MSARLFTNFKLLHKSFSTLQTRNNVFNKSLVNKAVNYQVTKRFESSSAKKSVTVYFIDRDGDRLEAKAKIGTNLLDVALDNNIDLEGFGSCEGTLSCSTCHLIFNKENFDKLKPSTDEEDDMLDLAFGLTDTSRLGCQIIVTENMDGWELKVPAEVADARDV